MIARVSVSLAALAVAAGLVAVLAPASEEERAAVGAAAPSGSSGGRAGRGETPRAEMQVAITATAGNQRQASGAANASVAACREAAWPYAERSCADGDAGGSGRRVRIIAIDRLPEGGRDTAAQIPGARLVRLDGVGHLPHVEDPGAFRAALDRFLAEIGAGAVIRPDCLPPPGGR